MQEVHPLEAQMAQLQPSKLTTTQEAAIMAALDEMYATFFA